MRRHPDIPFWLCVGDVGDDRGIYEPPPAPLYWIKGNNEDFDFIARHASVENLHFIPNAELVEIDGLRVAGVGGTFAPTWYDKKAGELPSGGTRLQPGHAETTLKGRATDAERLQTTLKGRATDAERLQTTLKGRATNAERSETTLKGPATDAETLQTTLKGRATSAGRRDDKRRHFVRDEVEAVRRMRDLDVLLTHEAPRPFRVGRLDAGKTPVNEMIASAKPRLHLCGHHHRFVESMVSGVRSVCLDLVSKSYLLIDGATLAYERRDTLQ
jgi:hypothetical protein